MSVGLCAVCVCVRIPWSKVSMAATIVGCYTTLFLIPGQFHCSDLNMQEYVSWHVEADNGNVGLWLWLECRLSYVDITRTLKEDASLVKVRTVLLRMQDSAISTSCMSSMLLMEVCAA